MDVLSVCDIPTMIVFLQRSSAVSGFHRQLVLVWRRYYSTCFNFSEILLEDKDPFGGKQLSQPQLTSLHKKLDPLPPAVECSIDPARRNNPHDTSIHLEVVFFLERSHGWCVKMCVEFNIFIPSLGLQ